MWRDHFSNVLISQRIEEIHEAVQQSPKDMNDRLALKWLYLFFDRPAFKDPYHLECSVLDFDKAIQDTIAAINTGILRTREGQIIAKSKPKNMFSDREWIRRLDKVVDILTDIRKKHNWAVENEIIGQTRWGFGFQ